MTDDTRVPLQEVRDLIAIGEPLPFRVLDRLARLLLSQGQRVASENQLAALLERGAWVEYEAVQRVRHERRAGEPAPVPSAGGRKLGLFDRWEQSVWDLDVLLRRLSQRQGRLCDAIEAYADDLVRLIDRDADVALFMAVKQHDRRFALYALTHGIHTATLAVLSARQLSWAAPRVTCVARAALTMNVSLLDLQATMAEQDTPPTKRQMEQIRAHPHRSAQMLQDAGVTDADWLAMVRDHHEQHGGGGYPQALAQVSDAAQLLRAADVLMASITPRALRAAQTPQQAARALYQLAGASATAAALIKTLGVHPPGELVCLRSGEVAIVTRRAAKGPAPIAASLSDRQGKPVVATELRDTALPAFAITGPCTDRAAFSRVLPERVYGWLQS